MVISLRIRDGGFGPSLVAPSHHITRLLGSYIASTGYGNVVHDFATCLGKRFRVAIIPSSLVEQQTQHFM